MTDITQLTKLIYEDIKRCEGEDWLEGVISLCEHLWEVRARIKSNQDYGDWIKATPLIWNQKTMGEEARQSLTSLGKNMKDHEEAIRKQFSEARSVNPRQVKALVKNALGADYQDINSFPEKTGNDETPTKSKGKGKKRKQKTIKQRVEEASAKKIEELKNKYEEALHQKDLAHDFNYAIEWERRLNEVVLPAINAELKRIERAIKSRKGILQIEEYNLLLRCLHPDVVAKLNDPVFSRRFNEALRLLTDKKVLLLPEKDAPTPKVVLLPETWKEFKKAYPEAAREKV
jgi:hypothetical protein